MPHFVVTGGAGFVGSHLCDALVARGDQVTVFDNLSTGSPANLAHLSEVDGLRFIEHDVVDPLPIDRRVDGLFHLASPASPVAYQQHPIATLLVGSLGTKNCLDAAAESGARFVLASTSEVYGDPLVHPQPEGYFGNVNPVGPRSCYDEAKRFAEALTVAYRDTRGVDVRIARIFNTYGPRMGVTDGRVISNFITQARQGHPLTVFGDGRHTRSFCYVSDLVRGLLALYDAGIDTPVNLGNPHELTVAALAAAIVEMTGSDAGIVYEPLPVDDPARRRPDISLAGSALGWEPIVAFDDGLRRTYDYFATMQRGPE